MSNSTIIGTTSSFNGVATFQSQPIITSTAPLNTDNSTNIATTAWANSFLTYTKTQANTWSGDQTFGTANVGILNADTIRGVSSTSNMSIGANLNGGSISIGGINSSTKILGTLFADTINSSSSTLNIGNNISTLNLNIGTNLSSGVIHIGSINKTTNISGNSVNIATTGIPATGRVNIATGTNTAESEVWMGSTTLSRCYIRAGDVNINHLTGGSTYIGNNTTGSTNILGNVQISTIGGGVEIATGALSGNITIGNSTTGRYTLINSKGITLGRYLSDGGYIDIGAEANTTTGYIILGSVNLEANYIRARNIYMNTDGTGNTNIGNTYGVLNLTSIYGLITSAAGNSANPASFLTISCKNGQRADALTIQSKYDYNWLIVFYNEVGVVRGKVAGIGSGGVDYQTNSDRRLKKNIQPMDSMLENIMRMKPSTFGWITNDDIGYGFIAQEVYDIFPHLRHKHPSCKESCDVNPCDCSGNPVYYGLDYGKFTPYIVKALQEMKISYDAKLQEQSDQITQLMARVAALESS